MAKLKEVYWYGDSIPSPAMYYELATFQCPGGFASGVFDYSEYGRFVLSRYLSHCKLVSLEPVTVGMLPDVAEYVIPVGRVAQWLGLKESAKVPVEEFVEKVYKAAGLSLPEKVEVKT